MDVYALKFAGEAEAAEKYAGVPLNGLKDAAKWLFSSHWAQPGHYGQGFVAGAKRFGHNVGDFARETVFGSPVSVYQDLKQHSLGGYLKNTLYGGSKANLALNAVMPAMSVYDATQAPEGQRGEAVGRAVAQSAALPFTARLGLPGAWLVNDPAARLGGRLGRMFDRPPLHSIPPETPGSYNLPSR